MKEGLAGDGLARGPSVALLPDGVFQGFARFESGNLGGFDLDRFAGLRVASGAGGTVGDLERAESDQRHRLLLFEAGGDGLQRPVDRASSGGFGKIGGFGHGVDEILFVHGRLPFVWVGIAKERLPAFL